MFVAVGEKVEVFVDVTFLLNLINVFVFLPKMLDKK